MKTATYPVVTIDEFKKILLENLIHNYKEYSTDEIFSDLIDSGLPKFNKDEMGKFMNELNVKVFIQSVLVDFNDSMFYWMVCGTDAILVKKPNNEA